MKRLYKLFITCISAALLIAVSSFSAFADDQAYSEMDEMLQEYAVSVITEITSETDETVLDNEIATYESYGYPGVANGFSDWKSLYTSVGALVSIENSTVTYGEDGSASVVTNVKFEKADVVSTIVLSADGYVTDLSFRKPEAASSSFGEKMKDATVNLVVGMGTVFAVLIFLCGVIYLFRFISKAEKAIADKKAAKNEKLSAEPVPAVTSVTPAPASDDELQAVIAAAIAAYEADNGSGIQKQPTLSNGINIKTYRRN